ncbi:MAG: hypothetical protein GTO63_24920, partial [Anaerolineae bacterium]|nr:hypothetical protein [Anaerolineae bacterium]NIN97970.1 hypothetical protein [Anaerolineae bacterium]
DGRLDHIFVRILYDTPPPIGVVCQDLTVVVNDPAGQLWFNGTTDTPPGGLWQEENVSASYQTLSTPGINVTNDDTEGACDVTLELLSDPG